MLPLDVLYPHRHLTPETQDELLVIQDAYEKAPLRNHNVLDWNGPLLYPKCVAQLANLKNATRESQAIKSLLMPNISSPLGPAPPGGRAVGSTWQLKLLGGVAVGNYDERSSQIWSCEVRGPKQEVYGNVILKLYFKGWFVHFNAVEGKPDAVYVNEEGAAMNEAKAYEKFQKIQGSQVPFCYGVYNFKLPGGFIVKGMVLEDVAQNLSCVTDEYYKIKSEEISTKLYERWVDRLFRGMCFTLHSIHMCDIYIGMARNLPKDMFVPENFPTSDFGVEQVVFVGFAFSYPLDDMTDPEEIIDVRGTDCNTLFENCFLSFSDAIVYRWQEYMRSGNHTIDRDPDIFFDDPNDGHMFPHRHGEFAELHQKHDSGYESDSDEGGSGSDKEEPWIEVEKRGKPKK